MKNGKLTRRDFIKKATFAGAGLAVGGGLLTRLDALAQESVKIYLPLILKPPPSRVIHVHDSDATYWNFGSSYYGNYVRQDVVNNMVDQGVRALTGAGSVAQAWQSLIPDYEPGKAIAIKVNFNNASSCDDSDLSIDALVHPVNAVIRGLKLAYPSLDHGDIWVYDAIRYIPNRFVNECLYSSVRFFGDCRQPPGWSSNDPDATVTFNPPSGPVPPSMRVPDVLVNATYLINMPIMKTHDCAGVTLGFKNHFGSINNPGALHEYMCIGWSLFRTDYSPLIDVYQSQHIGGKTVLTIGDGLFGASAGYSNPPARWATFGNAAPNSLFFSTDPVAVDCVMYDLLAAETTIKDNADSYLSLAADAGLGIFEHGDPWGSGYSTIDYVKIEL